MTRIEVDVVGILTKRREYTLGGMTVFFRAPVTNIYNQGSFILANPLTGIFSGGESLPVQKHQNKNKLVTCWEQQQQKKALKEKHFCSALHNVIWRRTKVQVVKCGQVDISTSSLSHTHTRFKSYMVLI